MAPTAEESVGGLAQRKRRRKALSCLECRRRKVKCDRRYPYCNRCRETGETEACVYSAEAKTLRRATGVADSPDSVEENEIIPERHLNNGVGVVGLNTPASTVTAGGNQTTTEAEDVSLALKIQARKIAELEGRLASLEKPLAQPVRHATVLDRFPSRLGAELGEQNTTKSADNDGEGEKQAIVVLSGRCFKTKFQGPSAPATIITHLPELGSFMRESTALNPSMRQARRELKSFTQKRKKIVGDGLISGVDDLLSLIPERDVSELQVDKYLMAVEPVYHILHVPSFLKEYDEFWEAPSKARHGFVPLLLLIMSAASCLQPPQENLYIGDSSRARESAVRRIEACDAWIERQSLKHVHLIAFQLRCLSLIAKKMNEMKMKAYFVSAGTLLRTGMISGLHRDPALFPKILAPLTQEMRKRVFATMMELELQAAVDLGLPSMSATLPFDCPPPRNITDNDSSLSDGPGRDSSSVDETTSAQHSSGFTDSSYLHFSGQSLYLRIHLNNLVNSSTPLSYADTLKHHDSIISALAALPSSSGTSALTIPNVLLDVQLRQFLLMIHAPFATQRKSDSRTEFSRSVCMNGAASIISQYSALSNCFAITANHMRNDIMRAALSLSHSVFLSTLTIIPNPSPFPAYDSLLQQAIAMQLATILNLGRKFHDLYLLSASYGLVMTRLGDKDGDGTVQMKAHAERITRSWKSVLNGQEMLANEGENMELTSQVQGVPVAEDGLQQVMPDFDVPFGDYDFELKELESWTWDDLWPFEDNV